MLRTIVLLDAYKHLDEFQIISIIYLKRNLDSMKIPTNKKNVEIVLN